MLFNKLSKQLVLGVGLVVAMGAFGASQVQAEQTRSRTSVSKGQSGSGKSAVRGSGSSRSRSGAGVTRSGDRYRSGNRGSRRGHSHHRSRYSLGLGYYGWGGYYGYYGGYRGFYYSPFYYGYPVYYSYRPERFRDFGALDLNVRPKKTEVWVDGQYVGTAGRFDGYPGYLWLGDGRHELIFYNQGFETVRREVKVLEGVVLDINQRMVPGASVPAEELTAFGDDELARLEEEDREPRERPRQLEDRRRAREHSTENRRPERGAIREDAREEPGRLKLEIAPADASIYLDGRFLGTGLELARLHSGLMVSPGEHTLEIVRPGFDSEEIPFTVEPGEETSLEIDLEARV